MIFYYLWVWKGKIKSGLPNCMRPKRKPCQFMPLKLLAFETDGVRKGSCCRPAWGASLAEARRGQLLQILPPGASWQTCGTMDLKNGGSTMTESVAWILTPNMSKPGVDMALGKQSPNQGYVTAFKVCGGFDVLLSQFISQHRHVYHFTSYQRGKS